MSPDAYVLAKKRIALDIRERVRVFARAHAQKREEVSGGGMGHSSRAVLASHELAREELENRGLAAWKICSRLLDADESVPDDATRTEVLHLITSALGEQSVDVGSIYEKARARMTGSWPDLSEDRARALDIATSEVDIDFLRRRRKQLPVGDVLRAPRYAATQAHWDRARAAGGAEPSDVATALKEAILALEALAKTVTPGNCATLGDCVKELRTKKLVDPGIDKILDGIWTYSNALPGIRHGSTVVGTATDRDWAVIRPAIEAALSLLLEVDLSKA